MNGLQVTGMRDQSSWGLYITNFMFFVGLSAGGLIISSAPKVFKLKGFGNISKVAVLTSIVCTILAICFVVVDLGSPWNIWHLFVYGHFTSPLMWDLCVLTLYLVLSIVYLVMLRREDDAAGVSSKLRGMSIAAFLVAILVHSVTAWIFSLNVSRAFWNTSLMAPWFVASALVSGTALVLVVVVALRRAGKLRLEDENVQKMAFILGVFVAVDLFFLFCDVLTGAYGGAGDAYDAIIMVLAGPVAPFFWAEVILGVVCLVIAFKPRLRASANLCVVASICAILGVFCKRAQIIEDGFGNVNLTYPGVETGPAVHGADGAWQGIGSALAYWPTGLECLVVLGIIALGVAVFCFVYPKIGQDR